MTPYMLEYTAIPNGLTTYDPGCWHMDNKCYGNIRSQDDISHTSNGIWMTEDDKGSFYCTDIYNATGSLERGDELAERQFVATVITRVPRTYMRDYAMHIGRHYDDIHNAIMAYEGRSA